MKNRLFISLNLPEDTIDEIIRLRKAVCEDDKLNWEPKERIHLTVKFIGDVSDEIMEKISDELNFVTNYSNIKCSINKFGFFFRDERPFIL